MNRLQIQKNVIQPAFRLAVITAILLSACSGISKSERSPLKVEWTLWWGDYTIIIAREKGFFEKHGVEVELIFYEVFSIGRVAV